MASSLKRFIRVWVYFFVLASIPSCMPVYGSIHRLLLSGVALSRVAVRSMASAVSSDPPQFSVSYVTAPNDTIAKFIAKGLIERKLAACVNIVPGVTSIYVWKNELQEDSEVMMIIKSRMSLLHDMTRFVRENHPYEVCEVISTPIVHGNPAYLDFLRQGTLPESSESPGGTAVKVTSRLRDGRTFVDISMFFASEISPASDVPITSGATITSDDTVFLVAKLVDASPYRSFVPVDCDMTATGTSSSASLTIVKNGESMNITNFATDGQSGQSTAGQGAGNYDKFHIRLNPAAFAHSFMYSNASFDITCNFRLCLNIPLHGTECDVTTTQTITARYDRRIRATVEDMNQLFKRADDAVPSNATTKTTESGELESCMDESAFIGIVSGVGFLLVLLTAANIVAAIKLCRAKSDHADVVQILPPRRRTLQTVPLEVPAAVQPTRPAPVPVHVTQSEIYAFEAELAEPAPRIFPRVTIGGPRPESGRPSLERPNFGPPPPRQGRSRYTDDENFW
ncbi:putative Protein CutA-like protein [Hypsibius exemplaris]|uniref:Uncharacterized protein n=1 Tax=Hypsibius exemplaris TaxID=2072580 RepID=A0A1W0WL74_HYPEX|nr:putative Protein CutA-like protein [Hypsibius exemplaris]